MTKNVEVLKNQQKYWDRTPSTVNADGTLNVSKLQATFDQGTYQLVNGTNGSINSDENGIVLTNIYDNNKKMRMDGDKIETTIDGGTTWTPVVSSDGSNLRNIFGGVLDVTEMYLKGNTNFFWNGDGLFAIDSTNPNKYIKFNDDGLFFTLNNGSSYELSMTWSGLTIGSHTLADLDTSITASTNFNNRNDRIATTPANPVILTDGTAVDHTISTDSSANISLEWTYTGSGDAYNIDGFIVYIYQSTSASAYTFGSNTAMETTYFVDASKRAILLYGLPANQYYTFGVQAYRNVDQDINALGIIKSSIVKATGSGENPYRPSSSVAFGGDVTGTVSGTSASTLVSTANTALATANTSVQQDTFYNKTKITTANGIQVFDASNVQRVKIGQTDTDKYGMNLYYNTGALAQETLSDGSLRSYDINGNIIFDSNGLNSLQLAGFGIINGFGIKTESLTYTSGAFLSKTTNANSLFLGSGVHRIYLSSTTGVTTAQKVTIKGVKLWFNIAVTVNVVTATYVDVFAFSLPYENNVIPSDSEVIFIDTSAGNIGSTGSIRVSAGELTRPDGSYFKSDTDIVVSGISFTSSSSDADGFVVKVVYFDSNGVVRYGDVGTSGLIYEIYPNVYDMSNTSFPNPRTTSIGGNPIDSNAIILGAFLCGWGLGNYPPYQITDQKYRDIRPLGIAESPYFGRLQLASSNVNNEVVDYNLNMVAGQRIHYAQNISEGSKAVILAIQKFTTNPDDDSPSESKKGALLFVNTKKEDAFGSFALGIGNTNSLVSEYYDATTSFGYLLSPTEWGTTSIYIERAWISQGDIYPQLHISFYSTGTENIYFRYSYFSL
jgi:hypothetical protein